MLRVPLPDKPRKLKGAIIGTGSGPKERIQQLQIMVTSLFRHERIEGREDRMQETRLYAEQLINLAICNGDRHKPTMDMADKWLLEKDMVHKLFKVYVPRFTRKEFMMYDRAFTNIYKSPAKYPGPGWYQSVLELKGNPYPPVLFNQKDHKQLLSNILISALREEYQADKNLRNSFFSRENRRKQMYFKTESDSKEDTLTSSESNLEDISNESNIDNSLEGLKDKLTDTKPN